MSSTTAELGEILLAMELSPSMASVELFIDSQPTLAKIFMWEGPKTIRDALKEPDHQLLDSVSWIIKAKALIGREASCLSG